MQGKAKLPGEGLDLRKMMQEASEAAPDPDLEILNNKLEAILPGITAGDVKKIELKNFSFDKIDQIMDTVDEFSDKKEKSVKDMAKEKIDKAKEQIQEQVGQAREQIAKAKKSGGEIHL